MRTLFLVPPSQYNQRNSPICRVYGCNYGFDYKPPIHLLAVATFAMEELGWEVRLLDCPAEGFDKDAFEAFCRRESFDVIVHWTTYLSAIEDLTASKYIANHMPGQQKHVFLGAASSWRPDEFGLSEHAFCILGEPEATLQELDQCWKEGTGIDSVRGLAWFDADQTTHRNKARPLLDVTLLPIPDRSLLKGQYRANRLNSQRMTVATFSRGCGFRCTFCATNALDQTIELEFKRDQDWYVERPPLRKRTIDQVVEEFERISEAGYDAVEIADNIFTWGRSRTMEICQRIKHLNLKWICLARANMLHDPETVRTMAEAGCQLVYMGSESFHDSLLKDMVKEIKVKDVQKAVQVCKENGVQPEVSVLMGGSPNETWKTLFWSWRAARKLGTDFVHFSVALPVPSSELYDQAIQQNWFVDGDFKPTDNARDVIVNLPNLSARELRAALKFAYAAQYLHPRSIMKHAQQVRNRDDFFAKLKAAGKLAQFLMEFDDKARTSNIPPGRVTPVHFLSSTT